MTDFFKVIKEGQVECGHCESVVTAYVIVYHDGMEECGTGHTYQREEDADDLCRELNWAFQLGAKSNSPKDETTK